ncbi:hypothetical protein QJS10_CPA05g00380 [Acorus calamus]|uniref:Uncharacterized protein n=1 Tax=Acorus calamus TaxID=4465 RepID=A0AAV9ER58_ACOCL|nr:hypothetical protein QJS10_CPA05g00380 [Acorus calamus]
MADKKPKKKTDRSKTLTLAKNSRAIEKKNNNKRSNRNKKSGKDEKKNKKKTGPRLPSSFRKELDIRNPRESDEEEDDGGEVKDLYEYDEEVPEEETRRNRRFDAVDNLEYELPEEFDDEDLPSDDDSVDGTDEDEKSRHSRMLQGITGIHGTAFEGRKRKSFVVSEANVASQPDDEGGNGGGVSISDLLDPLHGKPGYSQLRKRFEQLEQKKSLAVSVPLPRVERERLERKAAYEQARKDVTKWEPLVKRNREAPTLFFDGDTEERGTSTVGAIAADFEPRTEFEKKMAELTWDNEIREAHGNDGMRLLELNKISVEEVKDRQHRLAKMRSLLFRHEMKSKHVKKIKSKAYHRILKKERLKAASMEIMDPENAKEQAMQQEFKRAEERMTLKHKNSSKWAKRVLKRGLNAQDEGTRAAISEQLHQHALLTRKMSSMKENSSSEESSDEDEDELSAEEDGNGASKLLTRAKEKMSKVLDEEDEMPKSGLLSLPFMARSLKKKKEAALEEAQLAIQELDSSLKQLEDSNGAESPHLQPASGRKVFGPTSQQSQKSINKARPDNTARSSDSEDEFEIKEDADLGREKNLGSDREVQIAPELLREETDVGQETMFKSIDDIVKDPGPKTTYEVSMFVSDSWKKRIDHENDTDTEEEMVEGTLTLGAKTEYELPSQADLIHSAFAADDVEGEFEMDKLEVLNEENPEPEKPVDLPGWGQWTHVQQKKGLPSWILEEHENAKRKREEALRKRKDAHLKHVIISEKIDKKAEKLHTKTLPFPYTSKEVFEQSIRMPIGPEFNPATSVGALNRPAVVKKPGIIIKPITFEEVDPHEKSEEHKRPGQATKSKKKSTGRRPAKKAIAV